MDSYIESGDLKGPLAKQLINTYKQAVHHYEKDSKDQALKFIEKYLTQIDKPSMQKYITADAKEVLMEGAEAFAEQLN
ncbi:hypothetical protein [Gracilibacillus sp. JCM 18860]|uniref:FIMAH domain-containing protein n=1 Tax=Gracilibacillus sp. JCM 18860 TaxID=1306159 RepID=UPI0006D24E50